MIMTTSPQQITTPEKFLNTFPQKVTKPKSQLTDKQIKDIQKLIQNISYEEAVTSKPQDVRVIESEYTAEGFFDYTFDFGLGGAITVTFTPYTDFYITYFACTQTGSIGLGNTLTLYHSSIAATNIIRQWNNATTAEEFYEFYNRVLSSGVSIIGDATTGVGAIIRIKGFYKKS